MGITAAVTAGVGAATSAAGAIDSMVSGPSGGGGGSSSSGGFQSLGQDLTGILSGGLASTLGLSGLAGGNLNQLQAGAAAANPFGQYATGFVPLLQQVLGSGAFGLPQEMLSAQQQDLGALQDLYKTANIGTNTGALSQLGNILTPGQASTMQGLVNNPTQLLSSVQQGNSQIGNVLGQNPYGFTQGEKFQYEQGLGALQTTQAAQGLTGSGNQMAALEQYGQNFASQATQQNLNNMFQANSQAQGLQGIVNAMGQNQFGNTLNLGQFLSGQQQNTFANQLGTQQLQSQQQQNTQQNLSNILTQMVGINQGEISNEMGLLNPLLTATQASLSSPATAGGILSNLGVANQQSAGNLASGMGGLANGLGGFGNMLSGLNFGGGNYTGDFSTSGGYSSGGMYSGTLFGPSGLGSGYNYGGSNSYGFTM